MSTVRRLAGCAAGLVFAVASVGVACAQAEPVSAGAWSGPALISPGGLRGEGRVDHGCPTFSWAELPQAVGYELMVYEVSDGKRGHHAEAEAVLRVAVPAGGSSWTPDIGSCLRPGRYGWAVGAVAGEGDHRRTRWSRPAVFRVEGEAKRGPNGPRTPREGTSVIGGEAPPRTAWPAPSVWPPGAGPRAVTGEAYAPPLCRAGGEEFTDVPASDPFCHWIEQLARDGISEGCGGGNYCPDNPVTRRQLAAVVERAMRGTASWSPQQGSTVVAPPAGTSLTAVDDTATNVGHHSSITIGADGLPIISYYDAAVALKVAHCNDVACVGQDETITTVDDSANDVGAYTSITIGADGLPIISYYDATADHLKVAHCNDVACAGQDETITAVDESANDVGRDTSITIGADGLPIISYQDLDAGALKVAHCNDVACADQDETITTVDEPTNSVGSDSSITIGADGLPIISYREATAGALRVAHCNDVACAGQDETITVVDGMPSFVGLDTSITIGADGLPIISNRDNAAGALKVVHCNDVACTGQDETVTAVDDPANSVGGSSSITIGADGLPIISYQDLDADSLKVAHCNDVACTGRDETITTVDDPANLVGYETSITIGADGLPIISYYDATAYALKVAHCANVLCVPFIRRHGDPGVR